MIADYMHDFDYPLGTFIQQEEVLKSIGRYDKSIRNIRSEGRTERFVDKAEYISEYLFEYWGGMYNRDSISAIPEIKVKTAYEKHGKEGLINIKRVFKEKWIMNS